MNEEKIEKINPVFEIDAHSNTVCKSHSKFDKILANLYDRKSITFYDTPLKSPSKLEKLTSSIYKDPDSDRPFGPFLAKALPQLIGSCKNCDHYYNNECYFSKEEIDDIRRSHGYAFTLFFNKNVCELCGLKIRNEFNTMRRRYLEEVHKKRLPLICTYCNHSIKHGKIRKKIATTALINLIILLPASAYIAFLLFFALTTVDIAFMSMMLFFTVPVGIIVFFLLKRLIKLVTYKTRLKGFTQSELLG